jgi:hypothetical protein
MVYCCLLLRSLLPQGDRSILSSNERSARSVAMVIVFFNVTRGVVTPSIESPSAVRAKMVAPFGTAAWQHYYRRRVAYWDHCREGPVFSWVVHALAMGGGSRTLPRWCGRRRIHLPSLNLWGDERYGWCEIEHVLWLLPSSLGLVRSYWRWRWCRIGGRMPGCH